jgi:hypothetical protein
MMTAGSARLRATLMSEQGAGRQESGRGDDEEADAQASGLGDARHAERAEDLARGPGGENLAERSVRGAWAGGYVHG